MKFSIIIPAYNCERDIIKACDSVTDQGFKDFELIIVDDGSQDNTPTVIKRLSKKDKRIKPIFQKNGGPAKARNTGINAATGEYILFLDCDDSLKDGALDKIADAADGCSMVIYGFSQNFIFDNREMQYIPKPPFDTDSYYFGNLLNPVWNKAFLREFLIKNHIRFENLRYGEDRVFCAECIRTLQCETDETAACLPYDAKQICLIPETLYNYNVGKKDSLISSWYPQKFYGCKRAFDVYEDLCRAPGVPAYMFIKGLLSCVTVMFAGNCKLTYKEKLKEIGIMLNDGTTRRALEYDPAGGIHIKLIKTVFSAGNPKAVYLLGLAVYKTQNDFLPVFLKFRG